MALTSTNHKYGKLWFKWLEASKLYIKLTSFTEISSVLMCSVPQIDATNWVIWMFLKLQREVWLEHKQALLIILAHKYGMTALMMPNVTFGLLAVLFMRWPLYVHHLERTTWKNYMAKFKKAYISLYQDSIHKI